MPFTNKTLLIVEDDQYSSQYLDAILSDTGFSILHSKSGNQAVQIVRSQAVDIILMDIRLPDIEGYEATRIIKDFNPKIKIIAQTAYATLNDKLKAFECGCDGFLSKPVNKTKLLALINEQMSNITMK